MKQLKISNTFHLPAELAARTQAILAMKGVGKTYLAMKETEEMLSQGQQVICFDPTGVWFGLRSSADGKSDGFPILIFGGDNADVPLEPTAGEYLANFVQESGRSVILDMSHFESNAAQDRFVTDFATRLYRIKATASARNTIHLMLDEADSFAPQRPAKNQLKMLGAWEAIVRRGRSRGIGLTMITQRPAVLNKNVLSQVDLLVCLRIVGIHDFKAVKEWTDLYATPKQKKEFMGTLPSLARGDAWFWSPGWLRIFEVAHISEKITFDSSRTPEPGKKATTPKKIAPVDLAELTEQIRATVEEAKQNDPKALRQEVNKLRMELHRQEGRIAPPKIETKEVPVLKTGEFEKIENMESRLIAFGREFWLKVEDLQKTLNSAGAAALHPNNRGLKMAPVASSRAPSQGLDLSQPRALKALPARMPSESNGEFQLAPRHQALINALAFYENIGISQIAKNRHAAFVGRANDGGYRNDLSALRTAGIIEYPTQGAVMLTDYGRSLVTELPNIHRQADLHQIWLNRFPPRQAELLKVLLRNAGTALDKHALAESVGRVNDGGFRNDLSAMRTLGTIDYPSPGTVVASENLFPPIPE